MRLILKDGTVIEGASAGYTTGTLWCYMKGLTLMEAAAIFFDPKKTARIIVVYGEMEDVYVGYTRCTNLKIDMDGEVAVCLMKEE